ncbi:MAG: hypothetical protein MHM6MM_005574 [Cercozoa sp. M6MM]
MPSLRVGSKVPAWECTAVENGEIVKKSSADFAGKYYVLFFYPLDFTFVCPTEIIEFSEKAAEFEETNCAVVGASIDSEYTHLAWIDTPRKQGGLGEMKIPLLADVTRKLSAQFDALLEEAGHTCRATFIVDGEGTLRHMSFNDPPAGRNVDEVLRLVKAYQFVDEHGEGIPPSCLCLPLV